MKKYMCFSLTIISLSLIWIGCSDSVSSGNNENTSWVFVANEGYGCFEENGDDCSQPGNGSISMIDDNGKIQHIENIGHTVNSLDVYNDKLYVIVNQDHKILTYNINSEGISIENTLIIPNESFPREMVIINDKIYFTNWEPGDVKIMNVLNNQLEDLSILIDGRPEDIIFDGTYIWVSIPELSKSDRNQGTKVAKIDPNTNEVEYFEVGRGPQALLVHDDGIFISRTYYSDNWLTTYHGATKIIGTETIENTYGSGAPCGGSIISYGNNVYRSQNWIPSNEEGIVPLDDDLNFIAMGRIGNYQSPLIIYHMENIKGQIFLALTDYGSTNLVKILDNAGNEIASYTAGIMPGDLAYWKKSE